MKEFFLNMVKADNPTSSKRFAALTTLASAIFLAFVAAFKNNWVCPEFMYDGLLMVVAGLFGFNMAENIFKKAPINTTPAADVSDLETKKPEEETKTPEEKVEVDNPDK